MVTRGAAKREAAFLKESLVNIRLERQGEVVSIKKTKRARGGGEEKSNSLDSTAPANDCASQASTTPQSNIDLSNTTKKSSTTSSNNLLNNSSTMDDPIDTTMDILPAMAESNNAADKTSSNIMAEAENQTETRTQLLTPPATTTKVKRAAPKSKAKAKAKPTTAEPVTGGWDVLPHGMGKTSDLAEENFGAEDKQKDHDLPGPSHVKKRRGRSAAVKVELKVEEDRKIKVEGEEAKDEAKDEAMTDVKDEDVKEEVVKVEESPKANRKGKGRGQGKKAPPATLANKPSQITMETPMPKKRAVRGKRNTTKVIEAEDDAVESEKDDDFEEKPKRKYAPRKRKAVDTSENVLDKVDELINASGSPSRSPRKKKHPYGLTPGESPFPEWAMPTPEACEEVNKLLSVLHGEVTPPAVIPPPSMEVTGCGEVPDLLDAILRTLLSASTTANNSNMALKGLKDKFGLRTSGVGEGSVNWEAVHQASLEEVIQSIKKGGLAKVKGTNIKKILDAVYEQNCARRDAPLKEKETGEPAGIPGANRATQEQKDLVIKKANQNMLSMDHVFEMTTDEAMEEMTKLPGIGVKTASCVILFCMKRPSFAVDTHVWRHCKWLGWVPEKATRDQTFSHCEVRVPDHLKYPLHQLFLRHGKTCGRCRANTSAGTEEWDDTDCPIEHLVNRMEMRKRPGYKPPKKSEGVEKGKAKKGKKRKKGDETEESDVELSEVAEENEENEDPEKEENGEIRASEAEEDDGLEE